MKLKTASFFSLSAKWLALASVAAVPVLANAGEGTYPEKRPARATPAPKEGNYTVYPEKAKQVIEGLGFEIQSDSITYASSDALLDANVSVPHDLTPSERERFYNDMLKGFRYCRLAGGLYLRGFDSEGKYLQGRWPSQMAELKELVDQSGVEGLSFEYWSPSPYWKTKGLLGGKKEKEMTLRCYGKDFKNDPVYQGDVDRFLKDFSGAIQHDLQFLRDAGLPIIYWGLQNEPAIKANYSSCKYTPEDYSRTFLAVAPVVRQFDPKIRIITDTWNLKYVAPALKDPKTHDLIDALVVHHIGSDAKIVKGPLGSQYGKPSFQNEYEYLKGPATPARCVNTVMHIMNWFQLGEAPTWFWLHALKPAQNEEASGFSLGFWRPALDSDSSKDEQYKNLKPGHWIYNNYNWFSVGSFVRHMPWNCQAVDVKEASPDDDLRILAFKRPNGKLTIVLANRSFSAHTFRVSTGLKDAVFAGFRYSPEDAGTNCNGVPIGTLKGAEISPTLSDMTWEFWEQQ